MFHRRLVGFVLIIVLAVVPALAQQSDPSLLTLERLFSSEDFTAETFGQARWIDGGAGYTKLEASATNKDKKDIVRYETVSGKRSVLVGADRLVPPGQRAQLDIEDYSWAADGKKLLIFTNSKKVWRQNTRGDFWVLELATGKLSKLGGDAKPSTLMFAKFSPDGTRAGYVRDNNVYIESLVDGKITRLTSDGSRTIINGTFDWVYEEELDLRDGWRWSPDGKSIAYWQLDSEGVRDFYLINDTDELYSKVIPVQYPKSGTTNSAGRVGVVSAEGGATKWLEVPGDPRNNYIARMNWAANSTELVLQQLNRLQNTNRVFIGDARSGQVKNILTDRDEAWVDIQGDDIEWVESGKRFIWVSEQDGWRHAYLVSRDGGAQKLITNGAFDVIAVEGVDEAGGWLYYAASPENATQRYLYRSRLDGQGKPERVTPASQAGTHTYSIAPLAGWAFHTYSTFTAPPRIELVRLPEHAAARVLVDNAGLKERLGKLKRPPVEFFQVAVADGVQLDGWIIKPPNFDASKKYPILFHVYGEPASQTVLDRWGGPRSLWHQMLAQQGYLVASVDNRGTPAPRGRAWRKSIYRQIGSLSSQDQAAAARAICRRPYVDSSRVAIWGWSGGGEGTLSAIFRYPDVYGTGMAVAPVTDMRYYDTIYQERYMGLPKENAEDYKRCSPITYADQLKGNLLVVHGTGDDNVHYQNTEALINALVAANKPFTMMAYPNRTHAISEGKNTSRHLYELLTRYLREHVPQGPK
ncbi:MAG TPA: S9 family peptidase [Blastocatellia bacterium]|nr:S9 family peptidase [Blastocatellia bacterium]